MQKPFISAGGEPDGYACMSIWLKPWKSGRNPDFPVVGAGYL